ncbi:Glucose--fructose oxidoreductase [Pontiella sulfatireligans]|uniref:Glucose--fructose oxidoreductase n=2 Tax=Pontiella sulfatireligans TaxID=2750658 RepID=A0A6C2UFG5_9BACT|nr:Glucose--fructose oxidoreductase [Pontiella sulfatireligans]
MGCSSFAQRAMIPALHECEATQLVCVASRTEEKATKFAETFGCEAVVGYDALLERNDIDAVYMPLPTGLHEEWCTKGLKAGKHLLIEKSFAADYASAERMLALAQKNNCLIFENFQFQTHSQWQVIKSHMTSGELGDVHLIRSTFGFPPLPKDNFRWNAALGGGALLDAGAYMCKASQLLLGTGLEVLGASLQMDPETGVEMYGEATFRNVAGQVAQVAFGFDYFYQCRVELLGTKGKLSTNRVFTAPPEFNPTLLIEKQGGVEEIRLSADNNYVRMWEWFAEEVSKGDFSTHWEILLDQARLLNEIRTMSGF